MKKVFEIPIITIAITILSTPFFVSIYYIYRVIKDSFYTNAGIIEKIQMSGERQDILLFAMVSFILLLIISSLILTVKKI